MAEFTSRFPELTFYVNEKPHKFNGGRFATDDEATITVLSNIIDAERVDEPTEEAPKEKAPAKKPSGK